jgi:CheY-like chemotaxis protein
MGTREDMMDPTRRGTILVVDDEPALCATIQRMLAREHDVAAVTRAQEALDLIASGRRFEVILCDLSMPDMSGMDLHARLQAIAPDQADNMAFMTGGAFTDSARAFLGRIRNPAIEKPFAAANLRRFVQERLG